MKNSYPLALLWAGMFMAVLLVNALLVHPAAAVEQANPDAAAQANPGAVAPAKPVAAEQAKTEAGVQAVKAAVAQAKFDPKAPAPRRWSVQPLLILLPQV